MELAQEIGIGHSGKVGRTHDAPLFAMYNGHQNIERLACAAVRYSLRGKCAVEVAPNVCQVLVSNRSSHDSLFSLHFHDRDAIKRQHQLLAQSICLGACGCAFDILKL